MLVSGIFLISDSIFNGCADVSSSRRSITWDFTKKHDPSIVAWPPDISSDTFEAATDTFIRILVDKEHVFEGSAAHVYCVRHHGRLESVTVDMYPQDLAAVCTRANALMSYWGMTGGDMDAWRKRAASGDLSTYPAGVLRSGFDSNVSIAIVPSSDSLKPWHLMFEIFWKN